MQFITYIAFWVLQFNRPLFSNCSFVFHEVTWSVFCINGHVIHGFPHGELPLFVCSMFIAAHTNSCLKFAALL